jgi:Rrf2 family transcriptional regulator, cysteine metabolism repressor
MRVSAKCDYACKALLELSLHWPNKEPVQIHTLSERQDIPIKYLVHILLQLKRTGLVESVRGKEGGYILAKSPEKITLGEVMREIGGPLLPIVSTAAKKDSVFASIWGEVDSAMSKVLDKVTFEDILKRAKGAGGAILYQI